jgi:hypothetical protein
MGDSQLAALDAALSGGAKDYIPGLSQAEDFFSAIGLGSGAFAPVGRFAFGFGVTAGIQKLAGHRYAPWAYDANEDARPWKYMPGGAMRLTDEEGNDVGAAGTSVPWWMLPTIVGGVCGMFV